MSIETNKDNDKLVKENDFKVQISTLKDRKNYRTWKDALVVCLDTKGLKPFIEYLDFQFTLIKQDVKPTFATYSQILTRSMTRGRDIEQVRKELQ